VDESDLQLFEVTDDPQHAADIIIRARGNTS
jgi:hypothetical protein